MHFHPSPGSSPSKSAPLSMGNMASPSSLCTITSYDSTTSSRSTCAYPSWPTGHSLQYGSTPPSSYISDADLFGEDFDDPTAGPYLQEAPAPPRQPPMAQAFPLLPPLYASDKSKKQRRRSSGRKPRSSSKPMTPISESPEAHRE